MQTWRVIERLIKIKNSKTPVVKMNNIHFYQGNLSDSHKKKYKVIMRQDLTGKIPENGRKGPIKAIKKWCGVKRESGENTY